MIDVRNAHRVRCNVRHNELGLFSRQGVEQLVHRFILRKVRLDEVDAENCVHRQDVEGDDSALAVEDLSCVLAPAPGSGPQIDDGHPGFKDPVGTLNVLELEYRTRAIAALARLLYEYVTFMLGQPSSARLGTFAHTDLISDCIR